MAPRAPIPIFRVAISTRTSPVPRDQTMELIERLERIKAATLAHFELGEEDLEKTYAPGKWSIRYLLHHLADSESVLFYRIRRVISEPKQVIWVYDQNAW